MMEYEKTYEYSTERGTKAEIKIEAKIENASKEDIEETVHEFAVCSRRGCKFFCVYGGKILPVKFRYVRYFVEFRD